MSRSGETVWEVFARKEYFEPLHHVGTVTEEHDGKFKVTVGAETDVLQRPHGKDISKDTIVDLRHLLTRAGITGGSERSA